MGERVLSRSARPGPGARHWRCEPREERSWHVAEGKVGSHKANIIRWVARIWSLLLAAFAVTVMLLPDPHATAPVPTEDWFLLSLWGVAVLGLLLAWKWELAGAVLAIAAMFARELAWILLRGAWFAGFLLLWAAVLPPAILFLISWWLERRSGAIRT